MTTAKRFSATWEVESLIQWLKRISSGKPVDDECHFIEPVFSFQVIEDEQNGKVLRVNFSTRHFRENIDIQVSWIDFPFKNIDFDNAIDSLRRQLENYPKRKVQE